MMEEFDMAAGAVEEFLKRNKYAHSALAAHSRCYKRLRAYLAENNEPYSAQSSKAWLQGISPGQREGGMKVCRRALEKLDAAYHRREIGGASGKSAMRQIYRCLPPWCGALLDDFVEEMSGAHGPDYTQAAKISVARFLSRMAGAGICGPGSISHRAAVDYCREAGGAECASKLAASANKGHIQRFLRHLSEKGMVRASVPMALDQSVFPRLVFVESLDARDRDDLLAAAKSPEMSAESYYETVLRMDPFVARLKYAETTRHTFRNACKELFVFLDANSLGYSAGAALLWASLMSRRAARWTPLRRAAGFFEQFRENGRIDPGKIYRRRPDRLSLLPEWCRADCEAYIGLKEKARLAKSTLEMCRNSCLRLMEYLCSIGASSWGQITPEALKEFHRQDSHSTPEGKNAYSSKIRQFLEYLGEIGQVPPDMHLAMPGESAPRVSIVKTLSPADIGDIYSYRDSAGSAVELRGAAMVLAGLRMGLRASDIAGLRLGDIAWKPKHISVLQKKTGAFLKLPMPVEVGNAIYRYIMHGRPETDSEFVFVKHKAPYGRLHQSACRAALLRALPGKPRGFHATRRTFASRMLANGVGAGRIAETLGHAGNASVMPYLSTDGDKMRLCALPLDGIPLKGGLLA
jgi:integrase